MPFGGMHLEVAFLVHGVSAFLQHIPFNLIRSPRPLCLKQNPGVIPLPSHDSVSVRRPIGTVVVELVLGLQVNVILVIAVGERGCTAVVRVVCGHSTVLRESHCPSILF